MFCIYVRMHVCTPFFIYSPASSVDFPFLSFLLDFNEACHMSYVFM
jgi:hypothetical protein